jgi:hypothetical protein
VLGAEVFIADASACVASCCGISLGLLVSVVARRGSANVSGWVVAWVASKT